MSLSRSLVVFVSILSVGACAADAAELVPYQAPGWRYRQVAWDDPLTATFYATSFDDSEWNVSQAAFGNFGELYVPEPRCSAVYTAHTQWDLSTDALLRRYFVASSLSPVTVRLSVDNDVTLYVNGVEVFAASHEHCPLPDDFQVVVPPTLLSQSTLNLLAVRAHDRGWFSFVDVRVDGEFPPVSVEVSTWGAIKALYR